LVNIIKASNGTRSTYGAKTEEEYNTRPKAKKETPHKHP
jgi:hypothetical protein